ncbi:MAG: alkaline phosphatase family protein [Actinomycetota bacterium]|nr:alkaline phosphatase family protein [Actinomycetota bacterium]
MAKFTKSRLVQLTLAAALVGAPAVVLRAMCAWNSCAEEIDASSEVPFCSLPEDIRAAISGGFRDEPRRSPDLLAVTRSASVAGAGGIKGSVIPQWPAVKGGPSLRVPIVFWGTGVAPAADVGDAGLRDISETMAAVLGFERPDPKVRSGTARPGVASGDPPRLVVVVALKGLGSADLEAEPDAWPVLKRLLDEGAGTLDGAAGSLPLDPTATMTTIGTGGLPREHGIVGTLVRNDEGELVRAWGPKAPVHVIATLGDHLDEKLGQEPRVGLVASDPADRGLTGGDWYVEVDKDDVAITDDPASAAAKVLGRGYGTDDTPDLLGVAVEGDVPAVDADLQLIVAAAEEASDGSVAIAVAGTGSGVDAGDTRTTDDDVVAAIESAVPGPEEVVEGTAAGGLFLDQKVLEDTGITEDEILRALQEVEGPDGERLMSDAFPAIAVFFSRYC